jgi:predicted CoA-binding protein
MSKPTVAIVGASPDRAKFGNKSVRAHLRAGYTVFPVHVSSNEIEGIPAVATLDAVPPPLDRVSFYVSPNVGITLLEAVAAKAPREFFLNPGAESQALIEKARSLGLRPILACSIVNLGASPKEFP